MNFTDYQIPQDSKIACCQTSFDLSHIEAAWWRELAKSYKYLDTLTKSSIISIDVLKINISLGGHPCLLNF